MRTDEWELLADDRAKWRSTVHKRLKERENNALRNRNRRRNEKQNIYFISLFIFNHFKIS